MSDRVSGRTGAGASRSKSMAAGRTKSRQTSADRILSAQSKRDLGTGKGSGRGGQGAKRRSRGRRQGPDLAKILLIGIGVVILLLCAAVGLKSCGKISIPAVSDQETESSSAEDETEKETAAADAEITVNGISVTGLTKSEAKQKILGQMGWNMKVTYKDETKDLPNLMEANVDTVLNEAFAANESADYTVSSSGLEDAAKAQADALANAWDVEPKNGSVSSFDKSTGKFSFAGAENGVEIDREKLSSDILAAVAAGDYGRTITATANTVAPEISEEQARNDFTKLGTFTTTTTSNKDRNENIRLASEAINGVIIKPGEEFSFNETTGNRTTAKGYKAAGAYVNGVLVEEPGGGVCQVSSTLYNAVVFSGLKTTERHAHSYEPSYVTPGEDAMVSYDGYAGPDMKFVNNSKTAVGIRASFSDRTLTISIYGSPILEKGVTLKMKSEKVKELETPTPEYVEDPTLQPGVEVVVKAGKAGSKWETDLLTLKDGVVVSEMLLHNSTYNGKPGTVKRNTSGVVQTTEAPSSPAEATTEAPAPTESSAQSPAESTQAPQETTAPAAPTEAPAESPASPLETTVPTEVPIGPGYEDVTPPANSSGPGGADVQAETGNSPSDMGMISPIG